MAEQSLSRNELKLQNVLEFATKYVLKQFSTDGKKCYKEIKPHLEGIKKVYPGALSIVDEENEEVDMAKIDFSLALAIFTTVRKDHSFAKPLKEINELREVIHYPLSNKIFKKKLLRI